jgi:hypothetical protein
VKVSEQLDAESVIEMMVVVMMMMMMVVVGMILLVIKLTGICCEFSNRIYMAQVKVKCWAPSNKIMKSGFCRMLEISSFTQPPSCFSSMSLFIVVTQYK